MEPNLGKEIGLFLAPRQFRLARGPEKPGLRCDGAGVFLGGVQLLQKTDAGFAPRSALEIDVLTKAGYGAAFDTEKLTRGLAVASRALNDGDLGLAMVATLHLRLPDLDAVGAARLAAVDAVLAKYSPEQPRDWHGRWTSEGAGAGGPGETAAARPRAPHRGAQHRSGEATGGPAASGSDDHLVSHPTGGRLIQADWQDTDGDGGESPGFGDNSGARPMPEGRSGPEPDPDPVLPAPKVQPGWDQPYRVVNGIARPAGRYPKFSDGRPWPTAQADEIYRMLDPRRGALPFVKIYVPLDGKGPMLMGTTEDGSDYIEPPGYEPVYLRGVPQRTMSRGVETSHARESVVEALEYARTNKYSDIYFNRSFSTISNGAYPSALRGDVVGQLRPTLDSAAQYDVFEVLSPRQNGPAREQVLRPAVPGIGTFNSRAYKLLLKLLRALGIS
jgi:hypothetical protein